MIRRALAISLLVLPLAPLLCAAGGTVTGKLTDPQGKPVVGATLDLSSGLDSAAESASDPDGRFVFPSLAAGSYQLSARATGFADVNQTIHLGDSAALTVDLQFSRLLSGTVVDTSGAVIAGATVQVLSANGT